MRFAGERRVEVVVIDNCRLRILDADLAAGLGLCAAIALTEKGISAIRLMLVYAHSTWP